MIKILPIITALLLTAPVSAQTVSEPTLEDFAGKWLGKGLIAQEAGKGGRKGRCKVEATTEPEINEVFIDGFCAVASGKSRFALRMVFEDDGVIRAGYRERRSENTLQMKGTIEDTEILLSSVPDSEDTGNEPQSRIILNWTGKDSFDLESWIVEENEPDRQTSKLEFRREEPES